MSDAILDQIRSLMLEATRQTFESIRRTHQDETFYVFGLFMNEGIEYVCEACNSDEALEQTAEKYLRKHPDEYDNSLEYWRNHLRWSFGDFKWFCKIYDSSRISELISKYYDANGVLEIDIDLTEEEELVAEEKSSFYASKVLYLCTEVLQQLDREGFFGIGSEREKITLAIFHGHEYPEERLKRAKPLNPEVVIQRLTYELELETETTNIYLEASRLKHERWKQERNSRIRGTLLGLAAGDRNGGPVRMALELAKSLAEQGKFDPDDILKRYVDWWQREGLDTGPVGARVFDLILAGTLPQIAVRQAHDEFGGKTAGCNPAHRIAPLAMTGFIGGNEIKESARQEAALTHFDPIAGDIAAYTASLCDQLIHGRKWEIAVKIALPESVHEELKTLNRASLNRGGFAPDVFKAAYYFVDTAASFEEALTNSLAFAGANNYCPVLVGAIAGARWGQEAIPDHMLSYAQGILPEIQAVTERLVATWK